MKRRRLLAALAVTLAGCGGRTPSGSPTRTSTVTDSPTPSDTPTPTPRPGDVPAARVFAGRVVAESGLALRPLGWSAFDSFRYRTDGGETATVEPAREAFVVYDFRLANEGDERLDAMADSRLRLRTAGDYYQHRHELPGGVTFEQVAGPESRPVRPLSWYDSLAPGGSARLQLLFDAARVPGYRHYLAWAPPSPVDGSRDPVFTYPDG